LNTVLLLNIWQGSWKVKRRLKSPTDPGNLALRQHTKERKKMKKTSQTFMGEEL
jgi:hypothetical protein